MKTNIKNLVFASLCLAIGVILPSLFHIAGWSGTIFLPMHIPVLLCGLICGWQFGGLCGLLVPLLCSVFTGSPPLFPVAAAMMLELCAYGIISGALYKKFNVYISLVTAMIGGRIINGVANAVFMGMLGNPYGFKAYVTGTFITCLPGIIIQIILIPILIIALTKSKLITDPKKLS